MASHSRVSTPSQSNNLPTVPMSVYRELAGELQATKTQLEELKQENQQLYQQNQSLRLEISNLSQSVAKLEKILSHQPSPASMQASNESDVNQNPEEAVLTQQTPSYPLAEEDNSTSKPVNGWWVLGTVIMIVVVFTGLGYMVVQPLMKSDQ